MGERSEPSPQLKEGGMGNLGYPNGKFKFPPVV